VIREKLIALRERRAVLVSRADHQRADVLELVGRADTAMAWFERARGFGRKLRANPLWVVAGVALLVILRPRKALGLAATGLTLWRNWRILRATYERFVPRQAAVRTSA
jgi:hypothetical protein